MEWKVIKVGFWLVHKVVSAALTKPTRCTRFALIVHATSTPPRAPQWNAPSIAFYEKVLGAHEQSEWEGMRLEGDAEIGRLEKYLEGRE